MEQGALSLVDWILVGHKLLGFTTILVIAPGALLVTLGGPTHRRLGLAYVACMTLLYVSGTYFTFEKHDLSGWKFQRNFTFNLFGYSMLLLGWRALPLKREDGGRVSWVDHAFVVFLAILGVWMLKLGFKKWPMFVFGGISLVFAYVDWREVRAGVLSAAKRLERHIRYMIASYYYVVTLLSILLFPGTHKVKWVWPSAVAGLTVLLLSRPELRERLGWSRSGATRTSLRFGAVVAVGLGLAVLYDFAREGRLLSGVGG